MRIWVGKIIQQSIFVFFFLATLTFTTSAFSLGIAVSAAGTAQGEYECFLSGNQGKCIPPSEAKKAISQINSNSNGSAAGEYFCYVFNYNKAECDSYFSTMQKIEAQVIEVNKILEQALSEASNGNFGSPSQRSRVCQIYEMNSSECSGFWNDYQRISKQYSGQIPSTVQTPSTVNVPSTPSTGRSPSSQRRPSAGTTSPVTRAPKNAAEIEKHIKHSKYKFNTRQQSALTNLMKNNYQYSTRQQGAINSLLHGNPQSNSKQLEEIGDILNANYSSSSSRQDAINKVLDRVNQSTPIKEVFVPANAKSGQIRTLPYQTNPYNSNSQNSAQTIQEQRRLKKEKRWRGDPLAKSRLKSLMDKLNRDDDHGSRNGNRYNRNGYQNGSTGNQRNRNTWNNNYNGNNHHHHNDNNSANYRQAPKKKDKYEKWNF